MTFLLSLGCVLSFFCPVCKCAKEAGLSSELLQSDLLLIEFSLQFCLRRKAYISGPSRHLKSEEWGKECVQTSLSTGCVGAFSPARGPKTGVLFGKPWPIVRLLFCQYSPSCFGFPLTPLWLPIRITVQKWPFTANNYNNRLDAWLLKSSKHFYQIAEWWGRERRRLSIYPLNNKMQTLSIVSRMW